MASLGGEQVISSKDISDTTSQKENRPSSGDKKSAASREREEKLRIIRERQNEERQRKIEELKAQAEAAQKYREQKEEERRRRIDELRNRDNDRRQQVEERKRAIMEAEKERKEYILRKNQEREARLDTKKRNERSSITFAFGSSTPRLLDPAELGSVSPSTFWGHRRSTSITNVAYTGAPLTRRSSERELADGSKKRATSAGGIDRQNEDWRRRSTSMYEVFNWGFVNDEPPKRLPLSIAAADIDIDGPPTTTTTTTTTSTKELAKNVTKEETTDSPSSISYRSVYRRKTDLMPTIPSPREPSFGSKSSLHSQAHTPKTPGRAVSMSRLDQLAQPIRRNGEHIRAVIEREKQQQMEQLMLTNNNLNLIPFNFPTTCTTTNNTKNISRSMTHLAGNVIASKFKQNRNKNKSGSVKRSLNKTDTTKSMIQLQMITTTTSSPSATPSTRSITTTATKSRYSRVDHKRDDAPISLTPTGSRSGEVTPRGSNYTSRPGSAMSTSTTASGVVQRRSAPSARKQRPASIAVTGVSLNDEQKQKKDKPPLPKIQSTPKRSVASHTNSISKVSNSDGSKSSERRSVAKRDISLNKMSLSMTQSIEQKVMKNAIIKEKSTDKSFSEKLAISDKIDENKNDMQNMQMTTVAPIEIPQTKEEKDALNAVKTEINASSINDDTVEKEEQKDLIDAKTIQITVDNQIQEQFTEKIDDGSEKDIKKDEKEYMDRSRELSCERQENEMTASMIARSKITTEEEAKAALAERRRLAREEAERQAELERQRLEMERQMELKRIAEEEEKQRKFEEEALRLAKEQRKAEEDRLLQAIEEAKKREIEEKVKKEEEERLRAEKEENEKKAKEEAEKQRLEMAERLKREEKEREERRKRVEAIMSRTRAKGGNSTPNSTPVKENENSKEQSSDDKQQNIKIDNENPANSNQVPKEENNKIITVEHNSSGQQEQQQTSYEQSVTEKENALMKNFNKMIIDENAKNLHIAENKHKADIIIQPIEIQTSEIALPIANGNGHIENNLNKNDTNSIINVSCNVALSDQLIDFSNESQEQQQQLVDVVNYNNNNSLLTTSNTTTLVTADSHENKEISLL